MKLHKYFRGLAVIFLLLFVQTTAYAQAVWIKHPKNPVLNLSPGKWDRQLVGYHYVMIDGNTFKMWYSGYDGYMSRIGYATSPDGINWTKHPTPVLDLSAQGQHTYSPMVLYDGTTYKMWYSSFGFGLKGEIYFAVSSDGINWTSRPDPVLRAGSAGSWEADGIGSGYVIFEGNTYKIWYEGSNSQGSNIGYATSPDGISWTKHPSNPVFRAGEGGAFEAASVQGPCVIFDGTTYHMWYSGYDGRIDRIGYATSPNGINWTRFTNSPVLDRDNGVSWENLGVWTPRVIFDGNRYQYRMWYVAGEGGSGYYTRICYANTQPLHDMKFLSTVAPIPMFANIAPAIEVLNGGLNDEFNVTVNCQIDSAGVTVYSDRQTLARLNSFATAEVKFKAWHTYDKKNYKLAFYINKLSNDADVSNDTLRTTQGVTNLVDGFENGFGRWSSSTGWGLTNIRIHAGKFSLKDSPGTSYGNNANNAVTSNFSFDLSKQSAAHLSYWTFYSIQPNDFGYLEVSADGGKNWKQLGASYSGETGRFWKQDFRSLTPYCGPGFNDVRIRFRLATDSSLVSVGWFLDDIEIHAGETPTTVVERNTESIPAEFALLANYPNPFNPQTVIEYQLPRASQVTVMVFNLNGQRLRTLINTQQPAGRFQLRWDGRDDLGNSVASGVYFYQLQAADFSQTRKMILMR